MENQNVLTFKRYSNRKLYDCQNHNYITLPKLAELEAKGVVFQVIDYSTKKDITARTKLAMHYAIEMTKIKQIEKKFDSSNHS